MKKLREDEIRIATEAARWQQRLAGADDMARAEFADWVKASPRHLREFMYMEALDAAACEVDSEHALTVAEDLSSLDETVIELNVKDRNHRDRRRTGAKLLALAAGLIVIALGGALWFAPGWFGGWERFDTAVGEQKVVQLRDGSVARLNTMSKMRIRFLEEQREVRLLEGEALFKVAKDSERPFRVLTADAVIRAVGTEFNVYARSQETRVAVVEGEVEVKRSAAATTQPKSTQLIAGQTAYIRRGKDAVYEEKAEVAHAIAWQERRLVFQEESLGEIAEEFNRYNRAPKLVIENVETSKRRYGGSFNADDPQSLVRLVTRSGELQAERRGNEIVIRGR